MRANTKARASPSHSLPEQRETVPATIEDIMRTAAFSEGVNDFRNRRPPRFDGFVDDVDKGADWDYERGRHFAALAPRQLQIRLPGKKTLNPKAVAFYRQHEREIL
jgi:hypothetical protein